MDAGAGGDGDSSVLDDGVEDEMVDAGGNGMNEFNAIRLSHQLAICTIVAFAWVWVWDVRTCQRPQGPGIL